MVQYGVINCRRHRCKEESSYTGRYRGAIGGEVYRVGIYLGYGVYWLGDSLKGFTHGGRYVGGGRLIMLVVFPGKGLCGWRDT